MQIHYDLNWSLYHGTNSLYADIIVNNGISIFPRNKGGADFGPGFYMTTHFTQAKEWAMRRTESPFPVKQVLDSYGIMTRDFLGMKKNFKAVVLKFEIKNIENWAKCKHKVFKYNDEDWKYFVWRMRQANQPLPQYNYDWVYGFVADGGLQSTDYNDIRAYENKDQFAVLTKRAVQYLKISEVIKCL